MSCFPKNLSKNLFFDKESNEHVLSPTKYFIIGWGREKGCRSQSYVSIMGILQKRASPLGMEHMLIYTSDAV